ncbi:hypothetical protein CCR75_004858 [Bremia lactucae]|uniref:Uncharacterized protein n=1 Tax=Bremia lactucae TaxID=4779 RepID=A0A976FR79_BRELC|nr:hypothetical protein CCR75_004858 [Bremia lactucae]
MSHSGLYGANVLMRPLLGVALCTVSPGSAGADGGAPLTRMRVTLRVSVWLYVWYCASKV